MWKLEGCGPRVRRASWCCGLLWTLQAACAVQAQARVWTLDAVLEHAERHAPRIVAARARAPLGDAAMLAATPRLREHPELELGIGPRTTVGMDPALDVKLKLEQRVELGGQRSARIDAAKDLQTLEATRASVEAFVTRIAVRAAFEKVLLAHERSRSASQVEAVQARIVEIAEARVRAGDMSALGDRLAHAELAQTTQLRIDAEGRELVARFELAGLAGLPISDAPEVTGSLPEPLGRIDPTQLVERARTQAPARRSLLAELEELEGRARVAAREGWAGPAFGIELAHEDRNQNVALATISLPLPLFSTNRGARAQASAEREVAAAELSALDAALPVRVLARAASVQAAAARVGVFRKDVLPRFDESLAMIQRAFELGELDALEVSTARGRLVEAQRAALDGYGDYLEAIAALQLETGVELVAGGAQ